MKGHFDRDRDFADEADLKTDGLPSRFITALYAELVDLFEKPEKPALCGPCAGATADKLGFRSPPPPKKTAKDATPMGIGDLTLGRFPAAGHFPSCLRIKCVSYV